MNYMCRGISWPPRCAGNPGPLWVGRAAIELWPRSPVITGSEQFVMWRGGEAAGG